MSRRLGEILVDAQVLPQSSVAEALERQLGADKRLGVVLMEMGLVDEQTVIAALSEQFNMPVANLRHHKPDDDAVARLPEKMARSLTAAPMRLTPLGLEIAVADPVDATVVALLEAAAGTPVLLRLATVGDIRHAVDRSYPPASRHRRRPTEHAEPRGKMIASGLRPAPAGLDSLLVEAVRADACEVTIERQDNQARVLMRVNGKLRPLVIAGRSAADLPLPSPIADGWHHSMIEGRVVHIAAVTIRGPQSERLRLRLSYRDGGRDSLDQLGLPSQLLRSFSDHLAGPGGLILVTGSQRSGRSTTIDAAATDAAAAGRSVIAVVDHIPPPLPFVVGVVASAPGVWDAIEAQSPDVVTIDELDDAETGRRAIRLAVSGTTVVAAVVAPDAAGAIARLIALGIDRFGLANALTAVLVQRLDRSPATSDRRSVGGTSEARMSKSAFDLLEGPEVFRAAVGQLDR